MTDFVPCDRLLQTPIVIMNTTKFTRFLSKRRFFAVPIASIKELREGSATDAFTQCPEVYTESRCFSIIHGDDFSTLDLVFPTQEETLHWMVGLRYLLAKQSGIIPAIL